MEKWMLVSLYLIFMPWKVYLNSNIKWKMILKIVERGFKFPVRIINN